MLHGIHLGKKIEGQKYLFTFIGQVYSVAMINLLWTFKSVPKHQNIWRKIGNHTQINGGDFV